MLRQGRPFPFHQHFPSKIILFLNLPLIVICDDTEVDCSQGGFNRRDFQHSHNLPAFVILVATMQPAITAFGLGMSLQIKNFNVTLPDRLAMQHFMDRHGFMPERTATVQLHYRRFKAGYVIPFFHHKNLMCSQI